MRKGKMVAQGAHASRRSYERTKIKRIDIVKEWIEEGETKIAVGVENLDQLLAISTDCHTNSIPFAIITDAGHTEFNGVPTITALGIGPWHEDELDKITGKLKLL